MATPARRAAALLDELETAWARSDEILGFVRETAWRRRPIALRQPFIFYVGHLPAFAWNHLGRRPLVPEFETLFERGIDPPDDAEPTAAAGDPTVWPASADVLEYRDRVRREVRRLAATAQAQDVMPMVIEHELMHHETLLYMVLRLDADAKTRPGWFPAPAGGAGARPGRVAIPAGAAVLGAPEDGTFRWDNERPEVTAEVATFEVDSTPVTNRELLAFVEAGGYRDRGLWTEDGWRWREERDLRLPPFWTNSPGGPRLATVFDAVPFETGADWPAYVTHSEATAFARWRGARLMTEAEFHRAAYGTPEGGLREHPWGDAGPAAEHANLGWRCWGPVPAGSLPGGASAFGVHELVGNGWEWTATPFAPFPGFSPLPRYPGYSADFFDGRHFVLLGGSWATDPRLVRRSFRNWFQPHYPHVFAKFRCARSSPC